MDEKFPAQSFKDNVLSDCFGDANNAAVRLESIIAEKSL